MKIFAIFFRKNSYCGNLSEEQFFLKWDIVSSPGCNENKNVVKILLYMQTCKVVKVNSVARSRFLKFSPAPRFK